MKFLSGYKTYILAVLIAGAAAAKYLGYIDETLYQSLLGFLGAGTAVTLRAGIKNTLLPPAK